YLYCLSIFQRTNVTSAAPAFFAKADAKIRTFSDNLQTFSKVFCFYFLNPYSLAECQSLGSVSLAKRVQKYSLFGYAPNIFHYFLKYFERKMLTS
ncbi:hypothetical protein, partial [Bacteroides zhangwenhongii]|uniref:hypothetical protein n=1 Tax=Bacteroides zhangwenhongii TaxID=2650157 RepID=UPI0022E860CA